MNIERDKLVEMYRGMLKIRYFEQKVVELYKSGEIYGIAHVYLGQEAVAVGACAALGKDDYITSTHRGHGHCIAKGGDLSIMMAELLGKEAGYCRGKGGTMHIAELELGILGANGIVGDGPPIANGAAWASRLLGTGRVVVSFFGDGAVNTGAVQEAANMAAVFDLPVIFVCENNRVGEFSPYEKTTRARSVAERFASLGIPSVTVDGNDVLAVYEAVRVAVERARSGGGPSLVEALTYRWEGHYIGDPEVYRTKGDVERIKAMEPIAPFRQYLIENRVLSSEEADAVVEEVARMADDAVRFARESAFPAQDTLLDGAYLPVRQHSPDIPPDDASRHPRITYREAVNQAFKEEMARDDRVVVLGIDVGYHGGPFQTTKGLQAEFGEDRVLDTPISEAAIAGAAVGAALAGLRPVGIIMYGNFVTIASDQIINQAAKMRYMFGGKAALPLVFSTQVGIGTGSAGHHSDCWPEMLFSHIPGLLVAVPASPYDAKGLLKAAIREDNPVVFIERKRLYNLKGPVPEEEYVIPFGKARIWREGSDVTVIAYGSTVYEALEAADRLAGQGISVEVVDPRTLVPLDRDAILTSAAKTGRIVIAHEAPLRCGFGAEIAATISEEVLDSLDAPIVRLGGKDAPIPYSRPLEAAMAPTADDIAAAVKRVLKLAEAKVIGMVRSR